MEMASKDDDVSSKNDTKSIKLTVLFVWNGTLYRTPKEDPVLQVVEPVVLAIVLLVSFAANMFLLIAVTSSYTLRKVAFNVLIANLSIVCLSENLCNMLVALYYVTVDAWKLGPTACSINAFTVQLVTMEVTFGVCIMCVEGWMSLWRPSRYQNFFTTKIQTVAIATLWISGILLCLPLLVGLIGCRAFPSRYGCASTGEDGTEHGIFLSLWCYVLPVLINILTILYLGIRKCKDHWDMKSRKPDLNFTDFFFQGDLWTEWVNIKLVIITAVLYTILELPYIVIHLITEVTAVEETETLINNLTLPIVQRTPKYETTFTWFRYMFTVAFPVLTLWMRKDIRRKLYTLLSCCKNNAIRDLSPRPFARRDSKSKKKEEKKTISHPLSLTTPILYVTSEGLCLRQLDSKANIHDNSSTHSFPDCNISNWTVDPSFVTYLCDVNYSSLNEDSVKAEQEPAEPVLRRNSDDSQISVETLTCQSDNSPSSETVEDTFPMQDLIKDEMDLEGSNDPPEEPVKEELAPAPVKKKVRFSETLTIYRPLTPRGQFTRSLSSVPTISSRVEETDVCNPRLSQYRLQSKIPTRTPWKVEPSTTYRVSAPIIKRRTVRPVVLPPQDIYYRKNNIVSYSDTPHFEHQNKNGFKNTPAQRKMGTQVKQITRHGKVSNNWQN